MPCSSSAFCTFQHGPNLILFLQRWSFAVMPTLLLSEARSNDVTGCGCAGRSRRRPATRADLADSTVIGADKFARDAVLSGREFFLIS